MAEAKPAAEAAPEAKSALTAAGEPTVEERHAAIVAQIKAAHHKKAAEKLASLPEPVRNRVKAARKIEQEIDVLDDKMEEEIKAIRAKYTAQKTPLFGKRLAVVSGQHEPSKEEVPEDTEAEKEAQKTAVPAPLPAGGEPKGVPGFWLQALQNFAQLQEVASGWCSIQDRDQPALAYLTDVRVARDDDKCFVVEFEFRENPYFSNKVLSKTYYLADEDEPGLGDDGNFSHSEGTKPEWKPKQDLTVKSVQKKVKNRRKGGHTVQTVQESCESFFQYFSPLSGPEDEELDEEEADEIQNLLEIDYQIGRMLKELFVPHAVGWYTGEQFSLMDPDFDDEGEEGEDDEEEEGEQEDDEEEQEEEEEQVVPKGGARGGRGGGGGGGGGVAAPTTAAAPTVVAAAADAAAAAAGAGVAAAPRRRLQQRAALRGSPTLKSASIFGMNPPEPPTASAPTIKVAIEGCAHGELDSIYASLRNLEQVENIKVDLLICCGDFQAVRNQDDLRNLCAPEKYLHMNTFYKYYSGEKQAPVLTVFVGGNHEAYNHMRELPYGGWVAPNIYYLGSSGVVNFRGLRIAGYTGIYKRQHFNKGYYELPPYNEHDLHSVFHVRILDVQRLAALRQPVDVFVSHDWPRNITRHGDEAALLRVKPFLRGEISTGEFGSEPGERLLAELKPRYWFSAHMHCRFAALVRHADGTETRFLALDKVLPNRDFLQVLDLPVPPAAAHNAPPGLAYDAEWLALLRRTHPMVSLTRYAHLTTEIAPVSAEELHFVQEQLRRHGALIPENWTATVPVHPATGRAHGQSPQLTAQLRLLGIVTADALAAAPSTDPNAISLDDDDDDDGHRDAAREAPVEKVARADPNEIALDE